MSEYRLFATSTFLKDINSLPSRIKEKIKNKLDAYIYPQLRGKPHFGTNIAKLRDWHPETWRYRLGPWRIFYEIDEKGKTVSLITLHPRKESYR